MLFGVCLGPSYQRAKEALARNEPFIDGIEIRLDSFPLISVQKLQTLLEGFKKKVILTYRKDLEEGALLSFWQKLLALSPDYIDLDISTPASVRELILSSPQETKLILSYHNQNRTHDVEAIFADMVRKKAHIYKIATMAQSGLDGMQMLSLYQIAQAKGVELIALCMGERGAFTRVLAPIFGSPINYAALEDRLSAPGQFNAQVLREEYHFSLLSTKTSVYALIADPISHSIGALVHNELFRKKKQDAVYVKIHITQDELSVFFSLFRKLTPFQGLSISMPFKESSIDFVDGISKKASKIGAVNTVVKIGLFLFADNTDADGFLAALVRSIDIQRQPFIILGSGGAARAIAYILTKKGAAVTVVGRSEISLKKIKKDFKCAIRSLNTFISPAGSCVINTLPSSAPMEKRWIGDASYILDVSYTQDHSCISEGENLQWIPIFGLDMFLYQLFLQKKIWFKCKQNN